MSSPPPTRPSGSDPRPTRLKPKPKADDDKPRIGNGIKHLVLVGACYMDTILTVPHFPEEDSKLRAASLQVRRGGNCPNTLEVMQQLLPLTSAVDHDAGSGSETGPGKAEERSTVIPYLVSCLPDRRSPATQLILSSFGRTLDGKAGGGHDAAVVSDCGSSNSPLSIIDFSHCLYREGHQEPASSYIVRSAETKSRTIVNYNDLAEMTKDEFVKIANAFAEKHDGGDSLWHFEGRIPTTTLQCIRYLRDVLPGTKISVEVEKPKREGLDQLAAEADLVFYSRTWAESRGYTGPEACLKGEASRSGASLMLCTWGAQGASGLFRSGGGELEHMQCRANPSGRDIPVVDTIGAGDTFIAGILFGLVCHANDWSQEEKLAFATELATRKVQMDGFAGLGAGLCRQVGKVVG